MSYKQHHALAPQRHLQELVTLKSQRLGLKINGGAGFHSQSLGKEGFTQGCNASRLGVKAEAFHHSSQHCPVEAVPIPCRQTKHEAHYVQSKSYGMKEDMVDAWRVVH